MNKYFHEITSLSIVLKLFIHNISSKHDRETAASLLRGRRQIVKNFYFHFEFLGTFRDEAKAVCSQIVMFMTSMFSWVAIRPDLKSTFYLENDFGRKLKSRIFPLSIWQNISLVSLCDSFDALTASTAFALSTQLDHLAHSEKDCDWLV